jgi:hypothetical protein
MTITSPENGGVALIGKRGRSTPKLSNINAKETIVDTAADFISSAHIRISRFLASQILPTSCGLCRSHRYMMDIMVSEKGSGAATDYRASDSFV